MKHIFIAPMWESQKHQYWYDWCKRHIEDTFNDCRVTIIEFPDNHTRSIDDVVDYLSGQVFHKGLSENHFLVGHSLGCQSLLRFLGKREDSEEKIGGFLSVAGWFDLEEPTEQLISWVRTPLNYKRIQKFMPQRGLRVLLSEDDTFTDVEDTRMHWEDRLNALVHVLNRKGHFAGVREPDVLNTLVEMVGQSDA